MMIHIREATTADSEALTGLLWQLAEVIGCRWELSPAQIEQRVAQMSDPARYLILLAEVEQQVVGLLSLSFRHSLAYPTPLALIDELVVDAAHRGQGVGSRLIAEAVARCRARGCSEVEVGTESDNVAAQRFYRRRGFDREAVLFEMEFPDRAGSPDPAADRPETSH